MAAFVPCGYCYKYSSCSRCPPELRPVGNPPPPVSAGCQECTNRYERTRKDLTVCRKDLTVANDLIERQGRELKQLRPETKFLKLASVNREPFDANTFGGDFEIEVQSCVLQAHRLILADKSIVFRKMLENQMVEKETGMVRIHDTALPVMRAVIGFCYNAEISFTEEATPEEVLKIAHKYAIDHLRDVCAAALVPEIDDKNLADMLRLSTVCEAKELKEVASEYLKANFDRVFPSVLDEVFSCLTVEHS